MNFLLNVREIYYIIVYFKLQIIVLDFLLNVFNVMMNKNVICKKKRQPRNWKKNILKWQAS